MTDFSDKLRLKEKAEEDLYFAKRDQELIRALHEKDSAEDLHDDRKKDKPAVEIQEERDQVTRKHWRAPRKLAKHCRELIEKTVKIVNRGFRQ